MSSYTKMTAGWLQRKAAAYDIDYTLTALERQRGGDFVLTLDDPLNEDPLCYYLIEARDSDAPYGAPESGVLLYHVRYDHQARHAVVDLIATPQGGAESTRNGRAYQRPTLHGVSRSDGVREYACPWGGFRVLLVSESYSPYQAVVTIESLAPAP